MARMPNNRSAPRKSPGVVALLAVLALACVGCAGGRKVKATALPSEFAAPVVENVHTVDLSRLASYSVSSEQIDRGDVLEVTISTGYGERAAETTPVRVGEDGVSNVPLVGKVQLAGLELEGAEQVIAAAAVNRGVYRSPSVTVTMKHQRMNKITVIGAVDEPGVYELPRGSSTLLAAIVAANGLSKEAGTDVEIRRPALRNDLGAPQDKVAKGAEAELTSFNEASPNVARQSSSVRVNLVSAAKEGNGGYSLEDGDVIMVERRDPQPVQVIGLVHKPGQFEMPTNQEMRVLDAIALAGGIRSAVADTIHVIRKPAGQEKPVVIVVSLQEAKGEGQGNLRLASGDIVSVEQTPTTTFVDVVSNFFRFGFGATIPLF